MFIVILLILFALIGFLGVWLVEWLIHVLTSIDFTYDWATFEDFQRVIKTEKEKYPETRQEVGGYSIKRIHFEHGKSKYGFTEWVTFATCEKHNIRINKGQMVLNPISYLLYRKWFFENTHNSKRQKGLWG